MFFSATYTSDIDTPPQFPTAALPMLAARCVYNTALHASPPSGLQRQTLPTTSLRQHKYATQRGLALVCNTVVEYIGESILYAAVSTSSNLLFSSCTDTPMDAPRSCSQLTLETTCVNVEPCSSPKADVPIRCPAVGDNAFEEEPAASMSNARRYVLFAMFCVANALDSYNLNALFTALPVLREHFGLGEADASWVMSAFELTYAAFLLVVSNFHDSRAVVVIF